MNRIKIRKFSRKGAGAEKTVTATVPPKCLSLPEPQNSRGAAGLPLPQTAVAIVSQRGGVWRVGVWRGLRSWALVLVLMGLTVRAKAGPENENRISVIQQSSSPFRVTVRRRNPTFALSDAIGILPTDSTHTNIPVDSRTIASGMRPSDYCARSMCLTSE